MHHMMRGSAEETARRELLDTSFCRRPYQVVSGARFHIQTFRAPRRCLDQRVSEGSVRCRRVKSTLPALKTASQATAEPC